MAKVISTLQKIGSTISDHTGVVAATSAIQGAVASVLPTTRKVAETAVETGSDALLLSLSSAWVAVGAYNPATTLDDANVPFNYPVTERIESPIKQLDRFDTSKLFCLQLGDYFMPLSQTYTLRAKKRTNISSLVDGADIIQQTRKESKTIDCSLRITLRNNQPNLEVVRWGDEFNNRYGQELTDTEADTTAAIQAMTTFSEFLQNLYENDEVFRVVNDTINDVFGVEYAFMTEYRFLPQVGKGTFNFEFSLMEVKYGDNVLTFDARQISDYENVQQSNL